MGLGEGQHKPPHFILRSAAHAARGAPRSQRTSCSPPTWRTTWLRQQAGPPCRPPSPPGPAPALRRGCSQDALGAEGAARASRDRARARAPRAADCRSRHPHLGEGAGLVAGAAVDDADLIARGPGTRETVVCRRLGFEGRSRRRRTRHSGSARWRAAGGPHRASWDRTPRVRGDAVGRTRGSTSSVAERRAGRNGPRPAGAGDAESAACDSESISWRRAGAWDKGKSRASWPAR